MNINPASNVYPEAPLLDMPTTAGSAIPVNTAAPVPAVANVPPAQPASAEQVKQAVAQINHFMRASNRNLQFSFDEDAKRIVVKVTDAETGELIRQIPSEETLAISRAIGDLQKGLLLRQTA